MPHHREIDGFDDNGGKIDLRAVVGLGSETVEGGAHARYLLEGHTPRKLDEPTCEPPGTQAEFFGEISIPPASTSVPEASPSGSPRCTAAARGRRWCTGR